MYFCPSVCLPLPLALLGRHVNEHHYNINKNSANNGRNTVRKLFLVYIILCKLCETTFKFFSPVFFKNISIQAKPEIYQEIADTLSNRLC